jgi:Tol biopolymer transport system component/DNA-binding winged helix-turn-helix (wHTH) protein
MNSQRAKFLPYEFDVASGTLYREGTRLRLEKQPAKVLELLILAKGQMVTRSALIGELWTGEVEGDFDRRLDKAVAKLRVSLNDDPLSPRFVETIKGRGYRFISSTEEDEPPVAVESTSPSDVVVGSTTRPSQLVTALAVGALAAVILLGAVAVWKPRPPAGAPLVSGLRKLTQDGNIKTAPMFSDGERIFFREQLASGKSIIAQVSVNGGEVTSLKVPISNPVLLDMSKDGTELLIAGTVSNENLDDLSIGIPTGTPSSIWLQPIAGGPPHRIADAPSVFVSFGPDGKSLLYSLGHDVWSAGLDGSARRKLLTISGYPGQIRLSPDGKSLHFTESNMGLYGFSLMAANADGSSVHTLSEDGCCSQWTPDGRFLIFTKRTGTPVDHFALWALPRNESEHTESQTNAAFQLTSGPFDNWIGMPSKDGKEIFSLAWSLRDEVVRYDAPSHHFVPILTGISAEGLAFSPDGEWVAYSSYPDLTLWRSRADGSERIQLTQSPLKAVLPHWSPDGNQIAFNGAGQRAVWNVYVISSAGGTEERISASDQTESDGAWSPDGKKMIFGPLEPGRSISIFDVVSKHISELPGSKGLFSPRWSPNGKYIAAMNATTLHLMLYEVATQSWSSVSDQIVGFPVWSHDGKYLNFQLYPAPDQLYRIARLRLSDQKIETVTELDKLGRLTNGTMGPWLGIAPDDSPLIARDISTFEIYALDMERP